MNIRIHQLQPDDEFFAFEDERLALRFEVKQNKKKVQQKRRKTPLTAEA